MHREINKKKFIIKINQRNADIKNKRKVFPLPAKGKKNTLS